MKYVCQQARRDKIIFSPSVSFVRGAVISELMLLWEDVSDVISTVTNTVLLIWLQKAQLFPNNPNSHEWTKRRSYANWRCTNKYLFRVPLMCKAFKNKESFNLLYYTFTDIMCI